MAKNTKKNGRSFLVLVSAADPNVEHDSDKLVDIYADAQDCRENNDMPDDFDVEQDAKWIDVKEMPPHWLDTLEAIREGELAPESSVYWTDAAIWKYTELEMQGVC